MSSAKSTVVPASIEAIEQEQALVRAAGGPVCRCTAGADAVRRAQPGARAAAVERGTLPGSLLPWEMLMPVAETPARAHRLPPGGAR